MFTLGQLFILPFAAGAKILAAELMHYNLWIPLALGIATLVSIIIIVFVMPIDGLSASGVADSPEDLSTLDRIKHQTKETFRVGILSPSISFLLLTFLVTNIYGQLMSGPVFLQYVEERLGINLADVRNSTLISRNQ